VNSSTNQDIQRGNRIMGGSLIFVAIRCTLQYVVLPFVLPFIGLSSNFSVAISAILELIALAAIIYNIQRLWHTSWRWRYLGLSAFTITIIVIFLYYDARILWPV
jgi:ABC-type iron transport system FetAB permease component